MTYARFGAGMAEQGCVDLELSVDLWIWDLDTQVLELPDANLVLSKDERARADRFSQQIHRQRYIYGRARMRRILSKYQKVAPDELVFDYGKNGKPSLNGPIAFNLSHTENLAALCVVDGAEIGIDIQKYRLVEKDVAERFFAPAEIKDLSSLPKDRWNDGFFRCWTRKEAMVKAVGTGLSLALDCFDVSLKPDEPAGLLRYAPDPTALADWSLHHFDIERDVVGAIAIKNKGKTVKIIRR